MHRHLTIAEAAALDRAEELRRLCEDDWPSPAEVRARCRARSARLAAETDPALIERLAAELGASYAARRLGL